jgi:hypothetical protein
MHPMWHYRLALLEVHCTAKPSHELLWVYTHARRLGGCLFHSYHHTEETQQCLSVNASYTEECDNNVCSGSHGGVDTSHANLREKLTVFFSGLECGVQVFMAVLVILRISVTAAVTPSFNFAEQHNICWTFVISLHLVLWDPSSGFTTTVIGLMTFTWGVDGLKAAHVASVQCGCVGHWHWLEWISLSTDPTSISTHGTASLV